MCPFYSEHMRSHLHRQHSHHTRPVLLGAKQVANTQDGYRLWSLIKTKSESTSDLSDAQ